MTRRTRRMCSSTAALVALALLAAACGGGASQGAGNGMAAGSGSGEPRLAATLNGAGATFPKAFYEVAIESHRTVQPGVTVNYAGGGSGQGRQNL